MSYLNIPTSTSRLLLLVLLAALAGTSAAAAASDPAAEEVDVVAPTHPAAPRKLLDSHGAGRAVQGSHLTRT
jgi:hypothetical protein